MSWLGSGFVFLRAFLAFACFIIQQERRFCPPIWMCIVHRVWTALVALLLKFLIAVTQSINIKLGLELFATAIHQFFVFLIILACSEVLQFESRNTRRLPAIKNRTVRILPGYLHYFTKGSLQRMMRDLVRGGAIMLTCGSLISD